jgi:polyhydroxybutyrate depolymerase
VARLLDTLGAELRPDPRRIFVAGFSNGAVFSHYLAVHLARRIAAIATVGGGIMASLARTFPAGPPVSVFLMEGTDDPLVPFAGGPIQGGRLGRAVGADSSALLWEERDGIRAVVATGELPDLDPFDGCSVRWRRWSGGRGDTEIWLYALHGAGHTWPGGPQYLPRRLVGRVCRDFDASFAIWDFFSGHPKAPPRPAPR